MKELKKMTQRCANRLVMLYYEMDLVEPKNFDQGDCSVCVIGHGIKSGKMNGYTCTEEDNNFGEAIEWIGMPIDENGTLADRNDCEENDYSGYLFGNGYGVRESARRLDLPSDCETPKDAQKRIVALLHKAGFDF